MIGDRWGVTAAEIARRYPCDDFVMDPVLQAWRGVTVHATPEVIWPWIGQIRLGPYSYDWIDNIGHRSPQEQRNLPEPALGQYFTTAAGRPLVSVGDLVMARRQLRNLKRLAETSTTAGLS
ncbi:MAG TPA: hypothetical protein VHX15_05705 [Frankiaceae bacterium]|nr:hypothetical protein [Frankiaceae bacterium]